MKITYHVLDNNRPATWRLFKGKSYSTEFKDSWNNNIFNDLESAQKYAHEWMGIYSVGDKLPTNQKFDYSGYGDTIEIKEITE